MKQKHSVVAGKLSIALVFILLLAGCLSDDDGGGDDDNDDIGWSLPSSSGANEVGGKTWFIRDIKIDYTAGGAYTRYTTNRDWGNGNDYILDDKGYYTYYPIETGSYSWNETGKTVIHKKKTTVFRGDITNRVLLNSKEYKKAAIEYFDKEYSSWREWLKNQGISEDTFISGFVDDAFSAWMADYSLSGDGASLLMQETLPDNVPPDHFSGEIYMPANYMDSRYEFARDGTYAFWEDYNQKDTVNETGTFAYNGQYQSQTIFLRPSTIEGKTLSEYYNSIETVNLEHKFKEDAAYKAAEANGRFQLMEYAYSFSAKTIQR